MYIFPRPIDYYTWYIWNNTKKVVGIPTNAVITEAAFVLGYAPLVLNGDSTAVSWYGDPRSGSKSNTTHYSGTIGNLKMSSVPY